MKKFVLSLCMSCFLIATLSAQNVAKECVLFELFTGVNCPYCPANANGVAQMLAEELPIAPVAYHTNAFSTAPYYTAETNARASWYSITSYPTTKSDGVLTQSGGGGASQNSYPQLLPLLNQRIGIPSPFTINLTFNQLSGDNYQVNCTVNQVGENSSNNLKIMIVVTQSNIAQSWQGMSTLNCVCRDMIPTQNGTAYSGGTQTVTETFELLWPKEDCHLIAWVQDFSTKEVFQAVRMTMNTPNFEYDLSIKNVENVPIKNCSGKMNPFLTVKNEGSAGITSFDVVAKVDGTEVHRYTWNGDPFTFTQKVDIELDEFTFATPEEAFNLELSIENPNGQPDMNEENSSIVKEISPAPISDNYVTLLFQTDANPSETSVEIINMDLNQVVQRLTFNQANANNNIKLYFPIAGCYRFVMYDAAGNGITSYFTLRSSSTPPQTIYNGASTVNPFKKQVCVEMTSTVGANDQLFPPVNVNATLNNTTVNLSWEVMEGVAIQPESFNIYKNGTLLTNVTETSFSEEMSENGTVCYTIKSVANNVESNASEQTCIDVVVLYPPINLTTAAEETNVVLSWNPPTNGYTPQSYQIFKNGVNFATGITETSYTDVIDVNGEYCYSVKSIFDNEASSLSEESCIEMIVLYPPIDFVAEINGAEVSLSWNAPTMGYTPESYNIYRNDILLKNITTNSLVDELTEAGEFCYAIAAMKNGAESEKTEEECVTSTVNINEFMAEQIAVSPNPSKGQFTITTPISGNYQIAIYDVNGRKVLENDNFKDGNVNIDHCQKGVYLMTITTDSASYTKKIVIY
ncbi:MAG: T9SS type A sorting domain-containing protein [Bacteroidales bacterium]|nr:T9SS type A sorting domain-containing protein [Bacteroidales bacterium]